MKQRIMPLVALVFLLIAVILTLNTTFGASFEQQSERASIPDAQNASTATPFQQLNHFLDEAPFPRVYVFYHAPCNGCLITSDNRQCIVGGDRDAFLNAGRYANVVELRAQYGLAKLDDPTPANNAIRIDANGDGCDADDPRLVDWLENEAEAINTEREVAVPHFQLAFIQTWNFSDQYATAFNQMQAEEIDRCDKAYAIPPATPVISPQDYRGATATTVPWALHAAEDEGSNAGAVAHWDGYPLANVYVGPTPTDIPVQMECDAFLNPSTPEPARTYAQWYGAWLDARIGSVSSWDGVRIDSPGNIHSYIKPGEVDYDLDGHADVKRQNGAPFGKGTAEGRQYLNDLYREGVDAVFGEISAYHDLYHPDDKWILGGNDAWFPKGSDVDDPPGFSELPNMHFTIAENWTARWGTKNNNDEAEYSYTGWQDPISGHTQSLGNWKTTEAFANAVRIWDNWAHKGNGRKGYVILSKCDDAANDCWSLPYPTDETTYGWDDMHREFRFSLAAALMLDAYHAFTGEGYHMTPYWYDEYAVILKNGKPIAAKAGADENNNGVDDRAEGIGWLGYPVSDPLGVDGGGEVTNTSLCQALENTRSGQSPKVDDFPAWIRYFEYGVAILNPSSQATTTVKLDPNVAYYRIQCSKGNNWQVDADVDCITNNGQTVENHQVTVGPYDGLVLYGEANQTDKIAISASQYDIQYREAQELLFDDRGNQTWQWNNYTDETGPTINIVNDELREVYSGRLIFSISNTDLQQAIKNGDIIDAYLILNTSLELNEASMWLVVQRSPDDPEESNLKVPWTDRHLLGEGWHRTPSLKEALVQLTNQEGWDGKVEFFLDPDSFSHHLAFKTFDSGTVNAPTLVIIRKKKITSSCTTTNTTGTYQITYQHGANGYNGGEDTYIVTTDWEPPTTHDTFPALYIRVNYPNDQIYSSLIRFNDAALPAGAEIVKAQLDMYYAGQSVTGGDLTAYVAYTKEPWKATETTWVNFQTSLYWNATGVKGVDDRDPHVYVLPVNYQQVGNWLSFDVTQVVKDTPGDDYDFFFYGSFDGVNKNIYFHSNDYWKVSERPKLTIWYKMP